MNWLIDTHIALWWLVNDTSHLPEPAMAVLDKDPHVFLSTISIWEVSIKQTSGKLAGPSDLPERLRDSGFRLLPVTADHAIAAGRLPTIHSDPFDRMLIAQASCEQFTLMTCDTTIPQYDVLTRNPKTL